LDIEIYFFAGVALFVLLGPWLALWLGSRRRKRERAEDQKRWADLTHRVYALEQSLPATPPGDAASSAAIIETQPEPATSTIPPLAERPATVAKPAAEQRETPPPYPVIPPAAAEPMPTLVARLKAALDIEEALGTDWLNKLGIVILVLGIAFFLAYQLKTLGPAGKVLVGYACSLALLGVGIWLERRETYRILARAGIGGGWALLFFTTYALYHVAAARVLTSQFLDLALMFAVAAVMVWHTLRYRSQVVTGLAFLLAFLTVSISHDTVYSLAAGGVLAAGLVVIVGRMQWFELEILGIFASYFNHYLWLRPIIQPMHGQRRSFPEFTASVGMLLLYWAVFRTSYVLRLPRTSRLERVSTVAAVLNTALLLALFKYQSAHPEWAFWALLAIGAVETLLAQLPVTRRRRDAVIALSTVGVALLIAAFPFRYSGARLVVFWLIEAEALLLIGVWTREVIFRRLGLLASILTAGQLLSADAARICGVRMDGADMRPDRPLALAFLVAALVFYATSHWVTRHWSSLFTRELDRRLTHYLSYAGALMLLTGAWIAFPEDWTAVAWSALGFAIALSARKFDIRALAHQGNFLAFIAVIRVLSVNLESTQIYDGFSLRLLTILPVALLLYSTARWNWPQPRTGAGIFADVTPWINGAYTGSASLLLALLAWYELQPVGVAVAWVMGGVVLLELGLGRSSPALRIQAYLLFLAGFLRIFFVNLNAQSSPGEISPRFLTIVPMALAFLYGYWRLCEAPDLLKFERGCKTADGCAYLGTIALAALVRFELEADWVAAAWSVLAFALLTIAWKTDRRIFLHQALFGAAAVLLRTILHNFYERTYFPALSFWDSRWASVGAVVAILFAALPFALRMRRRDIAPAGGAVRRIAQSITRHPEQIFFFIAVTLLTVLLALEMRHGMVTLSWGLEGVAIFVLALWLAERSFRLTGLGLLLLCVGKILLVDVWRLNPRDRYLTLIVLGAALLLVSFLYTRNREALRQYL